MKFIGFMLRTKNDQVEVGIDETYANKLGEKIKQDILRSQRVTVRTLEKLLGQLQHVSNVLPRIR